MIYRVMHSLSAFHGENAVNGNVRTDRITKHVTVIVTPCRDSAGFSSCRWNLLLQPNRVLHGCSCCLYACRNAWSEWKERISLKNRPQDDSFKTHGEGKLLNTVSILQLRGQPVMLLSSMQVDQRIAHLLIKITLWPHSVGLYQLFCGIMPDIPLRNDRPVNGSLLRNGSTC